MKTTKHIITKPFQLERQKNKVTSQTNVKIFLKGFIPISNVTKADSWLTQVFGKVSTTSFSGSTFLNPFSSSPLWLLLSAAAALSQLHRSRGRWPPGTPPWPGSSSQVTPADTEASARRPLGKCAADSGPTGRRWPEPRRRPAATHRAATPRV